MIPSKHSGYAAGMRLYPCCGDGGSSAPAPDPALVAAQIKSMGIQDDSIKQIMANSQSMLPVQQEQAKFGLDSAKLASEQSQQDRTFALGKRDQLSGLQDSMVTDAANFNTADKQDELAGKAMGDVEQGFSSARDQADRANSRMGVNPSSGRAQATNNALQIAQAGAEAGAANNARTQARTEGRALTDRATNALAGYPAASSAATGAGLTAGTAGVGLANSSLTGMNSGFGLSGQQAGAMGQNATGMYGAQANYKNGQDQIAASNDPLKTILGAAAGVGTAWALK